LLFTLQLQTLNETMYQLYYSCVEGQAIVRFIPENLDKGIVSVSLQDLSVKPSERSPTTLIVVNGLGRRDLIKCSSVQEREWILTELARLIKSDTTCISQACSSSSSSSSSPSVDQLAESMGRLNVQEYENIKPVQGEGGTAVTKFCKSLYTDVSGKVYCRTDERHATTLYNRWFYVDKGKFEKNTSVHDFGAHIAALVSTIAKAFPSVDDKITMSHEFSVFSSFPHQGEEVTLTGRLDYLGVSNETGRLVVIEYKSATSSKFVNLDYLVVPDIVQVRIYALMVREMFSLPYTPDCYMIKFSTGLEDVPRNSKLSRRAIGLWQLKDTEEITTLEQAINVPLVSDK